MATSKDERIKALSERVARLKEANAKLRAELVKVAKDRKRWQRFVDPMDTIRMN